MDEPKQDGSLVTGSVLILLGLGLLALQFFEGFSEAVVFFFIGGLFVAGYLYRHAYGLLIPGGILLGLGLGTIGEATAISFGDLSAVGLGIGFLSIYVIDLVVQGGTSWWPLIPGGVLIATGLAAGNQALQRLLEVGWPLILVFAGLLILAEAFGRRPEGQEEDTETA